jgi:hypothetical protein
VVNVRARSYCFSSDELFGITHRVQQRRTNEKNEVQTVQVVQSLRSVQIVELTELVPTVPVRELVSMVPDVANVSSVKLPVDQTGSCCSHNACGYLRKRFSVKGKDTRRPEL